MVKTEMTPIEMLEKDHYKSIYNLTLYFQDKGNQKGLCKKHYLYALIPTKKPWHLSSFFEDPNGNDLLEPLIQNKEIIPGCIKKISLQGFLEQMVNKNILTITNPNEKNRSYTINLSFWFAVRKEGIRKKIDNWDARFLSSYPPEYLDVDINDTENILCYLHGFPTIILNQITKEKIIDEKLVDIPAYVQQEDADTLRDKLSTINQAVLDIVRIAKKYSDTPLASTGLYIDAHIDPYRQNFFGNFSKEIKECKTEAEQKKFIEGFYEYMRWLHKTQLHVLKEQNYHCKECNAHISKETACFKIKNTFKNKVPLEQDHMVAVCKKCY